jgi:hypothetical protein
LRFQIVTAFVNPLFDFVSKNVTPDFVFHPPQFTTTVEDVRWLSLGGGVVPFGGTTTIGWTQTQLKVTDADPADCYRFVVGTTTPDWTTRCFFGRTLGMYWTGSDGAPLGPQGTISVAVATPARVRVTVRSGLMTAELIVTALF